MRAEQYPFVRFLPAANFRDYIFLLHRTADAIRNVEPHAQVPPGSQEVLQPKCILARHYGLRKRVDPPVVAISVAIQQHPFTRGHPQDRHGAGGHRPANHSRRIHIFLKKIVPAAQKFGMNQENRALCGRTDSREISFGSFTGRNDAGLQAGARRARSPGDRNQMHGKWRGRKNLQMRRSLRPGGGNRVLFGVDIHARVAKRRNAPCHGARHLWRSAYSPANLVGEAAEIFGERRFSHGILDDLGGDLLA
jgi:hypothetical protein